MGKFDSLLNNNTGKDFVAHLLKEIDTATLFLISAPLDQVPRIQGQIRGLSETLKTLTGRTVKLKTELGD